MNYGFIVELPCKKRMYVGTLEEVNQRIAAGISGPDPCAEVEDMSARADLTGVDSRDGGKVGCIAPEVEAVTSPAPRPLHERPDLTVESPRVQLPANGHVVVPGENELVPVA